MRPASGSSLGARAEHIFCAVQSIPSMDQRVPGSHGPRPASTVGRCHHLLRGPLQQSRRGFGRQDTGLYRNSSWSGSGRPVEIDHFRRYVSFVTIAAIARGDYLAVSDQRRGLQGSCSRLSRQPAGGPMMPRDLHACQQGTGEPDDQAPARLDSSCDVARDPRHGADDYWALGCCSSGG
jgi:hypothetical protein